MANGPHGLPDGVKPEDILNYIYAVLYSPGYRKRYGEFLRSEFPRIPIAGATSLFHALGKLGGELVSLHLLEKAKHDSDVSQYFGSMQPEVEKITWSDNTIWLDKKKTRGFSRVPAQIWEFKIGGYQVCHKWLKPRKGRILSKVDIDHFQKIIAVLHETIRVMGEIEGTIKKHGGWPGAFVTNSARSEK